MQLGYVAKQDTTQPLREEIITSPVRSYPYTVNLINRIREEYTEYSPVDVLNLFSTTPDQYTQERLERLREGFNGIFVDTGKKDENEEPLEIPAITLLEGRNLRRFEVISILLNKTELSNRLSVAEIALVLAEEALVLDVVLESIHQAMLSDPNASWDDVEKARKRVRLARMGEVHGQIGINDNSTVISLAMIEDPNPYGFGAPRH